MFEMFFGFDMVFVVWVQVVFEEIVYCLMYDFLFLYLIMFVYVFDFMLFEG